METTVQSASTGACSTTLASTRYSVLTQVASAESEVGGFAADGFPELRSPAGVDALIALEVTAIRGSAVQADVRAEERQQLRVARPGTQKDQFREHSGIRRSPLRRCLV